MEHEGLYYFFEHGDRNEKLCIVDHRSSHDKLADKHVRYFPLAAHDESAGECFDAFTVIHSALPASVRVADYDYARPMLDISSTADVSDRGHGAVSCHAGRFFDPAEAKRFATLRAEELKAREVTIHATGSALHISAGWLVELADHPTDAFNTKYLAVEVHHFCNQLAQSAASLARYIKPEQDTLYRVETKALDASTQYRPQRTTPWPRVWGYEAGTVDGEADSDYAQLDDKGRYLVKFHFDESDLKDGKASTWVRMMQPHGGIVEGFHFPLRKGTEVIFTFLAGDPDRPVIAGVVPNTTTPSPVTEENRTQNVIRTGGNNQIVLDDELSAEWIEISTPNHGTVLYMGNPRDHQSGRTFASRGTAGAAAPAEPEPKPGSQVVDIPATFISATQGTQITDVSENAFNFVGGYLQEEVTGVVFEDYGNEHWTYSKTRTVDIDGDENRHVTGTLTINADTATKLTTPEWSNDVKGSTTLSSGSLGISAGETRLSFGNTSIDWMSTSGSIRSLELSVPGGIIVHAPSVNVITPSHKETNPIRDWMGAAASFMGSISSWSLAKKIDLVGLSISVTATKIGVTGLKTENHAGSLKQVGYTLRTGGPIAAASAVRSELSGFTSFT
jgi:type VI secretion system secreted protein VgrG